MKRMVHDFVYGLSFSTTFTGSFSKPNCHYQLDVVDQYVQSKISENDSSKKK
jgi:hypothetical protein